MKPFDYIVVGSGCAGSMAAHTLVDGGKKVVMLDVGENNPYYDTLVPNKDFLSLRVSDQNQYKYFIGDKAEGVDATDMGKGSQVTPTRQYMLRNVDQYLPIRSGTFKPMESLGYGGLGISWGLQCWEFNQNEIKAAGMNSKRMSDAYDTVSRRIGISATEDNASKYTIGDLKTYQDSPTMDKTISRIYKKYLSNKNYFDQKGFFLGRTPLALLTKDQGERKKYAYRDMDFYDDNGHSAWRPWLTVNALRERSGFTYIDSFLATSFTETGSGVMINGIDTKTQKKRSYVCKKLVLACGALGTARIALRSFGNNLNQKLPILCNPYTYIPCVQPAFLGQPAEPRKIGFGQLSGFLSEEATHKDSSILTLYSYQSLMMFRVIRQAPLNFVDARIIMQYLFPSLIIAGVQHSDRPSSDKFLQLANDNSTPTGDRLEATYNLSKQEKTGQRRREKLYTRYLRKTGVYAIKKIDPGNGASMHYAGVLPYSDKDKPFTLSPNGRIHGTKNVFVADSSGFKFLPARGLTFSILANAHITAENVLKDVK